MKRQSIRAFGPNGSFIVHGQTAKALRALIAAGAKGVTAFEVATWAYRFSAYCFDLRHKHGLEIATLKESHAGGWHGRHVLHTVVIIEEASQ